MFVRLLALMICLLLQTPSLAAVHILAVGQSNMEGRFGPAPNTTADPRIQLWDWYKREFNTAELGEFPFYPDPKIGEPANNLVFAFARRLVEKCDTNIYITLIAAGSMKIEFFIPQPILDSHSWKNTQYWRFFDQSASDELFSPTGTAIAALQASGGNRYDILLMHQGEANFAQEGDIDSAGQYAGKVKTFIQALTSRGLLRRESLSILGTINAKYPGAQSQHQAVMSLQTPTTGVATWEGIEVFDTPGVPGDRHATGSGLEELGSRYFDTYWRMSGGTCPDNSVATSGG